METLGRRARRIAKRQLYEATHAKTTTSVSPQIGRSPIRTQEVPGSKTPKASRVA